MRRLRAYQQILGISENPFPDSAIADRSDMTHFDPMVHPELPERMARVFLGPNAARAPKVTFLWSLGSGAEARGYGKSAYLIWMANGINADFGASFLRLCEATAPPQLVVAAYASFSTVDGALSLSGVLFNATRDFVTRYASLIQDLKNRWDQTGRSKADLFESARQASAAALESHDWSFLRYLVYSGKEQWQTFLDQKGLWHRQRWGRRVFTTLVGFLSALGVGRVLLVIDQLEDFTGIGLSYRHYRDFQRIADICVADPLFRGRLQITIALHPRAQFVMQCCWMADLLGPLPQVNDDKRCIIIGPVQLSGLQRLVKAHLSRVRLDGSDGIAPFSPEALDKLSQLTSGRPGVAIRALHELIEIAVDRSATKIDAQMVDDLFSS